MSEKSFTIDVAPLTVLPFRNAIFSYTYKEKLEPGTLVTVPFSGRSLTGVVVKNNTKRVSDLKKISAVEKHPGLTNNQLLLAEAVCNMTFTPLGKVLKHFVPKKAKARKDVSLQLPAKKFVASKEDEVRNTKILKSLQNSTSSFLILSAQEKSLESLFAIIQSLLKKRQGQILMLVPDIATAVRLEKSWEPYLKPGTLVSLYHTKTAGQYYAAWEAVRNGNANIIIGTRHGMFAPFKNLSTIIQLDPSEESYKQWDMSPRYHTEHVIPLLQSIYEAKYIGTGAIPPLSVLKSDYPIIPGEKKSLQPEWINLKIERYQKNWGVLSAPLEQAVRETLHAKKQVLLYVHQSGLESFSVCKECRTIFRCPSCKSALKLTVSDHYQCKYCNFKSSLFPQCPECRNIHFKSVGYGTEKVAREVKKMFPGALVQIADKPHLSDHKKVAQFLIQVKKGEPDILIATSSFLRFPPLQHLSLAAIIDADILLNLPGFRKDEQFIELIEKIKSLVAPCNGRLLVQSFHPESDLFQKIEKGDTQALLESLLLERKTLRYPPVYRSLTLAPRPKLSNGATLLQKATKDLKALVAKINVLKKEVLIQSLERKERGQSKKYTLIRYLPPLHTSLVSFLEKKADTLIIDHDPLHIT